MYWGKVFVIQISLIETCVWIYSGTLIQIFYNINCT